MEQLNIFSFNEEVFIDCNGNGPYDNLFNGLKRFTKGQELPQKYIINISTLELKNDDFIDIISHDQKLIDDLKNKRAKILINRIGEFDSFLNGKILGEEYERLFTFLDELGVPKNNILSQVNDVMNAILVKGERFGTSMFYGHGAGGNATASAIISNLVEAINFSENIDTTNSIISNSVGALERKIKNIEQVESSFYLRMHAKDIPGVMAEITNILAKEQISIEAVTQHEPEKDDALIPIVMITNSVTGLSVKKAIEKIQDLKNINGKVNRIRVLKLNEK